MALKEQKVIMPSTLETIDTAFYDWVNETLDISATTNRGFNKVPLIWVSAERAFQVKHDKNLRDDFGVLKLPLISVERTSVVKDPTEKVAFKLMFSQLIRPKGVLFLTLGESTKLRPVILQMQMLIEHAQGSTHKEMVLDKRTSLIKIRK